MPCLQHRHIHTQTHRHKEKEKCKVTNLSAILTPNWQSTNLVHIYDVWCVVLLFMFLIADTIPWLTQFKWIRNYFQLIIFISVSIYGVWTFIFHSVCIEVRGQRVGFDSLLPLGSQGLTLLLGLVDSTFTLSHFFVIHYNFIAYNVCWKERHCKLQRVISVLHKETYKQCEIS